MAHEVLVTDGFATLVAHVLAHVSLDRPGNIHDPRYVAWSRRHCAHDIQVMLEHDAELLARGWRANPSMDVLHAGFDLHRGLGGFRKTAGRSLAELDAGEVAAAWLLERLRAEPIAELAHVCFALVDRELERVMQTVAGELDAAREQLEACSRRLIPAVPGFADARIELVWALGRHGRGLTTGGARILVGAPVAWSACSPARQAVLAAHEHMVLRSGHADYLGQEWSALTALARVMTRLDDAELRDAHAAWLAELDLDAVLTGAVQEGWLTRAEAERLSSEPLARASLLAASS